MFVVCINALRYDIYSHGINFLIVCCTRMLFSYFNINRNVLLYIIHMCFKGRLFCVFMALLNIPPYDGTNLFFGPLYQTRFNKYYRIYSVIYICMLAILCVDGRGIGYT